MSSLNQSFMQSMTVDNSLGNERFKADKRQQSGLLFGLSIVATFFPLATLAGLISRDGGTVDTSIGIARTVAGLCVVAIGLTGMSTSYLSLVHDYGNKLLTGFLLILVQTGWIPYISDMWNVAKVASTGMGFIDPSLGGSENDVKFVGAMGILGIFTYGFCFLGSLAFMAFSLYAYQAGKPGDRAAGYYRGRLRIYAGMVTLSGIAQTALGAYILQKFGAGPLPAPINVTQFTVFFPEINIFVGIVYILTGFYGLARALGFLQPGKDDHTYQAAIWFQYLCTIILQILVQVVFAPGGAFAGAAPSRACLTLGAHVLPAYLDFKMRTTPETLSDDYYGLDSGKEQAKLDIEA